MDDREIRRYELHTRLLNIKPCIDELTMKLNKMKYEYSKVKKEYEALDKELMLEKRTILAPQGNPVHRQRAPRDLTRMEIEEVARKLGIVLRT